MASGAIPGIFAPHLISDEGGGIDPASPYWDGGTVNNTPLGLALKSSTDIDHLIVVTPDANRSLRVPSLAFRRVASSRS